MRVALVNPNWTYAHSIYFGCRKPHLPLELAYSKLLLERGGHRAEIIDGQMLDLPIGVIADAIGEFRPDMTVVTTAPSYLFWRCPPPELRVPQALMAALGRIGGTRVVVGPHGSVTPRAALRKLGADVVVMGECEEIVAALADRPPDSVGSVAYRRDGQTVVRGGPHASDLSQLPAVRWPDHIVRRHRHHHHRFDAHVPAPGAEVEASRGCPYNCSFCAKERFRDRYRRRPLETLLAEIDGLRQQGVAYLYFIDEIFLPNRPLLEALSRRPIVFGIQTRIDLWKPDMLDLLGRAGCVSIEAGVESVTEEGRASLAKDCRISTDAIVERLQVARRHVPFVQANLLLTSHDDRESVRRWRDAMRAGGIWANDPVPLFPYPGSPEYRRRWGEPDDDAWERAVDDYLGTFAGLSDLQDQQPLGLDRVESSEARP